MSTRSKAGRAIGSTLLNIAALGGFICIILVILAFFFNITLIMFKTGSMSPTIPTGSLAVVREIPASDIAVGDVLTVDRAGKLPVTHRVTSVTGKGDARTITMRGDANEAEDPSPYTLTEARRVLVSVPGLARVVVWFSNPIVLGGITIAASVLVTWAFWPREDRNSGTSRGNGRSRSAGDGGVECRGDGQARARHGAAASDGTKIDASRIGSATLALLIVGSLAVVAPAAPANAAPPDHGPAPASTPSATASSSLPRVVLAAETIEVAQGKYIALISIGDAEAMRSMVPGVPVFWQVGVQVDAPEPGPVTLSLEATGSASLGLSADIRACSVKWIGTTCGGVESPVPVQGLVPVDTGPQVIGVMRDSEERWILVSATVPQLNEGTVSLEIRAEGHSDSVAVGPGTIAMIARTGASYPLSMWLAVGAVSVGLLVAGAARLARRSDARAES